MKKLTLFLLLTSLIQVIHAQEETSQRKFVLGGSINFLIQNNTYPLSSLSINSGIGGIYSNSTNDSKNTSFAVTPYFGFEMNPNTLIGLLLDYRKGSYEAKDIFVFGQPNTTDFERNSNQFGVGMFYRYMFNPEKQFNFFLQPYFEYNSLREEESQNSNIVQKEKASFIELGVGLGLLYNINDRMRATLRTGGINYVNGKWEIVDTDTKNDFSSFGTNINLSTIFFGFEIKI